MTTAPRRGGTHRGASWCSGVALLFLGGSIGYFVTQRSERHPGAGSVDVGFLQDMRYHHDQATQMSLAYLQKPAAGQDPTLRTIAAEILLGQQLEAGAMVQLLHDYGQPDSNESGTGMAWMSMPLPIAPDAGHGHAPSRWRR